jgi:beta-glucosidase
MAQATFHFPRGFLWGTATASHQVEGNNTNNNWWAWEQEPGRIREGHKSGLACDWWSGGRWREDFDRAADAGQNAHRLSVEWSRVQPAPNRWDENALDRYREMVRGLNERGLMPLVTLHHFTDPVWVAEQGSWENEAIVEYFVAYVKKVVDALREYVTTWVTINEPNVLLASAYLNTDWPPGRGELSAALQAMSNMVRAHAAAYRAIHALQPQSRVGVAIHYRGFHPLHHLSPLDKLVAGIQSSYFNEAIMSAIQAGVLRLPGRSHRIAEAKGTQDYVGLNYYTREYVSFSLAHGKELFGKRQFLPNADLSDGGFIANSPQGFYEALKWATKFKVPIIVTENGVNDIEDHLRPRYTLQHLHQLWRAVNYNWPVKGYFHWSLVDNFEWERGWTQRFGLWELDPVTQARRKRPSADLYAEICRENGISSAMVTRYAPELLQTMFPDE